MPDRRPLTSVYRLQLHAGFTFADTAAIVPYLDALGVSHLYLSPVLQAAPGSTHGYDVVDHSCVSADLGGEDGLVALADRAHEHGLGVVVDVVPNHVALPEPLHLNRPLWETLRLGREAETAHWFDVDWDHLGGRFGLPVLGSPLEKTLAAGELSLDEHDGEQVVRYFDQVFPVAPGTEGDDVAAVLERQHYLLAGWREKDSTLVHRRFFDVDTLVAVRVELDDVFDATHHVLVDLHARGVVDGFRIDHPDGLADPQGYLDRLRDATDGAWVVVEKILEGDEPLPAAWATAGTTGYDATRVVQTALTPGTGDALDALWRGLPGADPDLHAVEHTAKVQALDELLRPELRRLVRRTVAASTAAGTPLDADRAEAALRSLLAQVRVYRAYVRLDEEPDGTARGTLTRMRERAAAADPELSDDLDVLVGLLLDSGSQDADTRDLVVRFGQVCGPVMAKGVEDTTFYRWHRLSALNEVGGDPLSLDHPGDAALHTWSERQLATSPAGLTTLSTHDTKRGEDTRAQLLAAAEDVEGWTGLWDAVRERARSLAVDEPTAYLVMQTVVGAWPVDRERLLPYLEKAVREAKQHTAWVDGDEAYEGRVRELGASLVGDAPLAAHVARWTESLAGSTRALTLGARLLQLGLPGVPDVYQGAEAVHRVLVDPDNRRPVDHDGLARRLTRLDAGDAPRDLDDEKLWVVSRALRLRREHPDWFDGSATYRPLRSSGDQVADHAADHTVGYVRHEQVAVVTTRWPWALRRDGWGDAAVELPSGTWTDLLTGNQVRGGAVDALQLFATRPVALLVREAS